MVAALAALLPAHALLWHREDTLPYECDGLTAYRQRPLVVALPETEAQVAAVLQGLPRAAGAGGRARRRHRAVGRRDAARAGRDAVAGQVQPHPEDRPDRAHGASCNAACATSRSARRLRRYGLYYAPDPSSQIACTIGGNVAENSGGVHCLKYGLTLHNVLQVRGFTVEGERGRVRRRGARLRRARPAGAARRQRRHARGHHRGHGQAGAEAAARALHHGELRRRRAKPATRSPRSSPPASSRPAWR